MRMIVLSALTVTLVCARAAAQAPPNGTLLYSFKRLGGDAGYPYSGVIRDAAGNLYGTEAGGGPRHSTLYGTVYELSPPGPGQTSPVETVLHTFEGGDGAYPEASLVMDASGNLYGTTTGGGSHSRGVVFELSPPAAGQTGWTYTLLHDFAGEGGSSPRGSLLLDGAGALFGTTRSGGTGGYGTVFQLTPPAPGETVWKRRELYSFDNYNEGCPQAAVISGGDGSLYGTTAGCYYYGLTGTVFRLSPGTSASAPYVLTILYAFSSQSEIGASPDAPLIMDASGALYGTTSIGKGKTVYGAAFKLTPPAPGGTSWIPSLLHGFTGAPDGATPQAALLMDSSGDLFGTTYSGGTGPYGCCGTVFKLTPPAPGQTGWAESSYTLQSPTGYYTSSALIFDEAGSALIGTSEYGGPSGSGSVFSVVP